MLGRHLQDFLRKHIAIDRVELSMVDIPTLQFTLPLTRCLNLRLFRGFDLEDDLTLDSLSTSSFSFLTSTVAEYHLSLVESRVDFPTQAFSILERSKNHLRCLEDSSDSLTLINLDRVFSSLNLRRIDFNLHLQILSRLVWRQGELLE